MGHPHAPSFAHIHATCRRTQLRSSRKSTPTLLLRACPLPARTVPLPPRLMPDITGGALARRLPARQRPAAAIQLSPRHATPELMIAGTASSGYFKKAGYRPQPYYAPEIAHAVTMPHRSRLPRRCFDVVFGHTGQLSAKMLPFSSRHRAWRATPPPGAGRRLLRALPANARPLRSTCCASPFTPRCTPSALVPASSDHQPARPRLTHARRAVGDFTRLELG